LDIDLPQLLSALDAALSSNTLTPNRLITILDRGILKLRLFAVLYAAMLVLLIPLGLGHLLVAILVTINDLGQNLRQLFVG
jgi:hypothetical protein